MNPLIYDRKLRKKPVPCFMHKTMDFLGCPSITFLVPFSLLPDPQEKSSGYNDYGKH